MDYKNPLILTLTTEKNSRVIGPNHFAIGTKQLWAKFKTDITKAFEHGNNFDYVAIDYSPRAKLPESLQSMDIMTGEVARRATTYNMPAISRFDGNIYQLNRKFGEGYEFMPSNDEVMAKFNTFNDRYAWQAHQAGIWSRFAEMNKLKDGSFGADHKSILTAPGRGLTEDDVRHMGSFSIQNNKVINPALIGDDMVGMPGIKATKSDDRFFFGDRLVSEGALSLQSLGSGYVIPMKNKNGDMAKFQIGSDVTAYNLTLKARASDGVSIQRSEIYDKKTRTYLFKTKDGADTKLKVVYADNQKATFEDTFGQFEAKIKDDIKGLLESRGYDIHPMIDRLNVLPQSKYAWPAQGNMVGTTTKEVDVPKTVSPSVAGFIPVREPATPDAGYNMLVVEGALKGYIVATYLGKEELTDVTNSIAPDGKGLIVAQIPGVSEAFIRSVTDIYTTYKVDETVVAMDADGRSNLSVARAIHQSEEILGRFSGTRVMSWNPDQKGLDDALIALGRGEITTDDLGLTFGSAKELFPMEQASAPNPYKLNGERANKEAWRIDYTESLKERDAKKQAIQQASQSKAENMESVALNTDMGQSTNTPTSDNNVEHRGPSDKYFENIKGLLEKHPIHRITPDVAGAVKDKLMKGEIAEDDVEDFISSVSEISESLVDQFSSFAGLK